MHALPHLPAQSRQSLFKMMPAAVTPPQQQDRALGFHTDSVRKKMEVMAIYHVSEWFCLWRGQEMCPVTFGHIILNY